MLFETRNNNNSKHRNNNTHNNVTKNVVKFIQSKNKDIFTRDSHS